MGWITRAAVVVREIRFWIEVVCLEPEDGG